MLDQRYDTLKIWLDQTLPNKEFAIHKLAGDASFRRYFRVQTLTQNYVAMDAPPEKEDCKPFVAIAKAFLKLGVTVPAIIAQDLDQGFILLSDLGDDLYLNVLNEHTADQLYCNAIDSLALIQTCQEIPNWKLPNFAEPLLLREWNLFDEWVVHKHWDAQLTSQDQSMLKNTFELLQTEFLAQPKTCVHRDYHSRNLLQLKDNGVGVLDFQDAVWGPITYDLISLLRDCYVSWPQERVAKWVQYNFAQLQQQTYYKNLSSEQFQRWFDLLGIQRHLKCLGIFSRLNYLYEKPGYLKDIAPTLNYILMASENYPELTEFKVFLQRYAV